MIPLFIPFINNCLGRLITNQLVGLDDHIRPYDVMNPSLGLLNTYYEILSSANYLGSITLLFLFVNEKFLKGSVNALLIILAVSARVIFFSGLNV